MNQKIILLNNIGRSNPTKPIPRTDNKKVLKRQAKNKQIRCLDPML